MTKTIDKPMSPKEWEYALGPDNRFKKACTLINQRMLKDGDDDYWSFTVEALGGRKTAKKIVDEYEAKGWKIELVSDQREGDFVQIWRPNE